MRNTCSPFSPIYSTLSWSRTAPQTLDLSFKDWDLSLGKVTLNLCDIYEETLGSILSGTPKEQWPTLLSHPTRRHKSPQADSDQIFQAKNVDSEGETAHMGWEPLGSNR